MSPQPLPPKKVVALALIEQSSVHLHLDPRAPGVVVPAWFKQQPQLVLQVGLNLPKPIPDLYFDDEKMSCTLSFNNSPFFCIVPWDSVFAMRGDDGRGMVWPDRLGPPEVAKAGTAPREATPAEVKEKEKAAKVAREKSTGEKVRLQKSRRQKRDEKVCGQIRKENRSEKVGREKAHKSGEKRPEKSGQRKSEARAASRISTRHARRSSPRVAQK